MNTFPPVSMLRVNQARELFFGSGSVPPGLVSDAILRSWERSAQRGVEVGEAVARGCVLSAGELALAKGAGETLLQHSMAVMESLYQQIRQSSSMVILTDASGVVLHSLGDADFVGRAEKVALGPGGVWTENLRGTNAIGTALVERSHMLVHRAEHFSPSNGFLTCAASPIFDPFGRVSGVLDVSGDGRGLAHHTMALVRISAQQIENQMFAAGFDGDVVVHFHTRPEVIGTLYEGILVFSDSGRLKAANRSALLALGLDRFQMTGIEYGSLFDLPFSLLVDHAGLLPQPLLMLCSRSGVKTFARVRPLGGRYGQGTGRGGRGSSGRREGTQEMPRLDDLELGDEAMQKVIARARRILGHDIPVMIEGESGTGKEMFARALHAGGPRRSGPFVALNCAAIPESLIEAELFGYEEGAFTGARRKGYAGKVRQAHGGTLFLDEIGDMPLGLQARLLRVLQERAVCPLGGVESHQVDISVICATNRRIRDEVAAGAFREDLYYRLNGLLLSLPGLAQRQDRIALARSMIRRLGGGPGVCLSAEAEELFRNHPWPGNLRQMHNVLRTALALLDGMEIRPDGLPEDFLEQYQSHIAILAAAKAQSRALPEVNEGKAMEKAREAAVRQVLENCAGNFSAAARALGVSRTTLYRWKDKGKD